MSRTRAPGSIISAISRRSRRNSSGAEDAMLGPPASIPSGNAALRSAISAPETGQAVMLGTAGQKAAQCREQLRLVQQNRIVALVGPALAKADIGRHPVPRMPRADAAQGRQD